ncbi:MAG: polyamine ABC transporter ATP-binding protein, partial [Boseongicola sp. SB0667_bin_21]|nr:polyamine ABC transporter ATP-binding protein [Boseongicola sp. SB0667_bin_21]
MAQGVLLQDVVKSFGEVTVIPKLNLDVKEGEFVVLVGP